jgi:hypothetical protein
MGEWVKVTVLIIGCKDSAKSGKIDRNEKRENG